MAIAVLFLPEASDYIASSPQESLSLARPVSQSPFVLGLQSAAKQHNLHINVGIHVPVAVKAAADITSNPVVPTVPKSEAGSGAGAGAGVSTQQEEPRTKLFNRTIWIDADGTVRDAATYDKLHLFDYGALRESTQTQAGTSIVQPFDTPVGRVGALICFDLRFPEPAIRLAHPPPSSGWKPAQLLTYPSAFTVPTGRAHWEVLLRARAIESQSYVVAAAQVGNHNGKRVSYGRSMAVDPWGKVLCALGGIADDGSVEDGAVGQLGLVDVDLGEWDRIRESMPLVRRT
ncbi:putative nitrilase and fragile histidine triad fusion protein hit protein [Phaeoacremonium minimum UCRPA7]|uniref:Putative nitrilase and fragile histidine triad fusion protein hit protein n=1 Tax=Phaeoacremonium minimum (strain UCR-PA7) TaxID=1286976 RepID=R8BAH8_PHAM7|nr:putative nitrilase and fragile histidine triad fusion protein hit protein [Phaeoacremonium minimum UCRPA7]EON96303.1 putative nitrilase and fragile histidine triad fusion protein hit protein [Phaeoacremonium minimum UCRPA7]